MEVNEQYNYISTINTLCLPTSLESDGVSQSYKSDNLNVYFVECLHLY